MAETTTVTVTGLAELERSLHDLDAKVAKNVMRRAVAAGGRVIRDLMRLKARRKSGRMAAGIGVSTRANPSQGQFIARVRPSTRGTKATPSPAYEALWNEFGVKPHEISTARKGKKKALKLADATFRAKVHHPGVAPYPFMRAAADEGWPKAVDAIKETLAQGIAEATKK